jgi:two-component system, NarL family, sensor kinase
MNQLENQYLVILFGSVFFALVITIFVIAIVYAHQIRQKKNKNKLEQLKSAYEKILLDVKNEIQQETLSFVGRELHDNIGQLLSLVKLNLSSSKPEIIEESKDLLSAIIREVRSLSKVLDTDWLTTVTIDEFIQKELEKIQSTGFCKTHFQSDNSFQSISKDKKLILIRAIQECLNNIIKHSSPQQISVEITSHSSLGKISIQDDGIGFDPSQKTEGTGLKNLKKRMESLGGEFLLKSELGKGTITTLCLSL